MIVVIGAVAGSVHGDGIRPAGLAARIAGAAVAAGARAEVVTRLGQDRVSEALLLAFAESGVGHVATLRDPSAVVTLVDADPDEADPAPAGSVMASDERPTDPGPGPAPAALDAQDVGLALRYLPEIRVIVLVHPGSPAVVVEAADGASYAGASMVVIWRPDDDGSTEAPDGPLALVAADDADGVAELVGRYAAAIDRGDDAAQAFATTLGMSG